MKLLGFRLNSRDIDAYYYANAPKEAFCPVCGCLADRSYTPSDMQLKQFSTDVAFPYDSGVLVSQKFADFCRHWKIADLNLIPVNKSPALYALQPKKVLLFDSERRRTRFLRYCKRCGQYEEVIGAKPAYLKGLDAPLANGIYRTDLEFGSGRNKSPLIIVSVRTKDGMDKEGITGVMFDPVQS